MTEKRCRHKWEWTPNTWTHHEDLTKPSDATNTNAPNAKKPNGDTDTTPTQHARAANKGRGQHM